MITDPKTAAWLDLLDPGDPAPLEALRAEAEQAEVKIRRLHYIQCMTKAA